MPDIRKYRRREERNFSAHHILYHAATRANDAGKSEVRGSLYQHLAVMTFSSMAIEAFSNAVGERVISGWDDYEGLPPNAKLRLLSDKLGIEYNKGTEPWGSAIWLFKFRNR